jgi:hypothetical protein
VLLINEYMAQFKMMIGGSEHHLLSRENVVVEGGVQEMIAKRKINVFR